jgi:hypothetical protein
MSDEPTLSDMRGYEKMRKHLELQVVEQLSTEAKEE